MRGMAVLLSPPGRTSHFSNSLNEMLNFSSPVFAMSENNYQIYVPDEVRSKVKFQICWALTGYRSEGVIGRAGEISMERE